MKKTDNLELNKPDYEDKADIAPINENMDKIDLALKTIETEARNKDGGNADTVDGYHASEFTKYREFNSLDELAETQYEGLFYIGGSEEITGISLKSGRDIDVQPDNTDFLEIYTRIYSDKDGKMYAAADVYSTEYDFWTRKSLKTFSFDGHPHSVSDIEDFPKSLPASGGNADTVGGKQASDFALKNHSHNNFSAWDSDSDSDTSWGVSISASGINFQWNDDINDSELHISENGLRGGGSFLPAVSNFGNISAESFSGNGSNLTNVNADMLEGKHAVNFAEANHTHEKSDIIDFPVSLPADGGNADTIAGKSINAIQTRDSGYCFYNQNKDWNDLTDTGYYGLMHSTSTALHNPVNGKFFYPMVFKYANDSVTQIAVPHLAGHDDGSGMVYIRSKNSSYNGWSEWAGIGDGCNAASVNKKTVSFTASAGNWYRLAKGKPHNNSDNTGACGIMTIMADVHNYHSSDVISLTQNGGDGNFTILNHSRFNQFFTKFRMSKGADNYMYIDGYTNTAANSVTVTFTFSGIGWTLCESIVSVNAGFGVLVMEKEPEIN